MTATPVIRVQPEAVDLAALPAWLDESAQPDAGASASFIGTCRSEDGRLAALELEHFPGMAEAQLHAIATEACRRWPLAGLLVVHRYGKIRPGEIIVHVAAASRSREPALQAVSFVMDYLKTDAPFWKKEWPADGSPGQWVEARISDDNARMRWTKS